MTSQQSVISTLWGNTAYCERLSGKDLSRCSTTVESFGLRKCPYYHCLTKKVVSQYQTFRSHTSWQKIKQLAYKHVMKEITSLPPCVYEYAGKQQLVRRGIVQPESDPWQIQELK